MVRTLRVYLGSGYFCLVGKKGPWQEGVQSTSQKKLAGVGRCGGHETSWESVAVDQGSGNTVYKDAG